MKKVTIAALICCTLMLQAGTKIFVNNARVPLVVTVQEDDKMHTQTHALLQPGAIKPITYTSNKLRKIKLHEVSHKTMSMIASRMKSAKDGINENSTFIINKDRSINMYHPKDTFFSHFSQKALHYTLYNQKTTSAAGTFQTMYIQPTKQGA